MTWKLAPFFLLAIFAASCASIDRNHHGECTEEHLTNLKTAAWDAQKNDNKNLASATFEKICACHDVEGCLNAASYYNINEPAWVLLYKQACDLGNGNACFWLGETTAGDIAKSYYEKGCSLPAENADGNSCRMAGIHNAANYEKSSYYFEKGCLLGDAESCIEASKIIQEQDRKLYIKKLSCEIGIPEVCD